MVSMNQDIDKIASNATKWSGITEIVAKLVTPIVSMVMARLLTPEAYGVVATVAIVISFAELFTDAGFQKYLIQHEFKDDQDKEESTTVAFWSNFALSVFFWIIIALFNKPLAALVGSPGLGNVLIIAAAAIPITAFSSIQMALYKRDFNFKTLFKIRIVGIIIPLFVTLPLAYILRNFWAIIISNLLSSLINAILLTYYSSWKPRCYFSFEKLRGMFAFSMWSMFETFSIWATSYLDIFIVSSALGAYYLGIYKTSMSIVGQITGIITAATTPVLFSALSRLQNDEEHFKSVFFKFQKYVSILIFPVGVLLFVFSDFFTSVFLGNQWGEASGFIGWWGLTSSFTIVLSHYSSEVYRSKGRPKLSFLAQIIHLCFLVPTVLLAVKYDFQILYISRSLVRFTMIIISFVILYCVLHFPIGEMMCNVTPSIVAASIMGICSYFLLSLADSTLWTVVVLLLSIAIYLLIILLFPSERAIVYSFGKRIIQKKIHK